MLHRAIEKCGRDIVLSLSPGPAHIDRAWEYCRYANMWRITDDFWDKWELIKDMFVRCELWQDHVRKGCFPDCDMLPVGKVGKGFGEERDTLLTKDEQKTMMTLWCMFRSPLMVGAELTTLDDWTLQLLTNAELLVLMRENRRGVQIVRDEYHAVWKNVDSKTGESAVALFNLSDETREISVSLAEIDPDKAKAHYILFDIWDKTKAETADGRITATVPAHGVTVYNCSLSGE